MRQAQNETQARFAKGTTVRVRIGVMDPDFPSMHLGGWVGTVARVHKGELAAYLVQWSPSTLKSVPPAIREFCEKEDIVFDKMWLLEEDLEAARATKRRLQAAMAAG